MDYYTIICKLFGIFLSLDLTSFGFRFFVDQFFSMTFYCWRFFETWIFYYYLVLDYLHVLEIFVLFGLSAHIRVGVLVQADPTVTPGSNCHWD